MGRPKSVPDADILAAAARVIGRRGPTDFTIRDVAQESGLSAAAVMQRFGTKRALVLALERQSITTLNASFAAARDASGRPLEVLVTALVENVRMLGPPEEMANHIAFLAVDLADEELRAHVLAYFAAMRHEVNALLDEAVAEGGLHPGTDVPRLAQRVEVAYHGALFTWAVHRRGTLAELMREAVWGMLGPARS